MRRPALRLASVAIFAVAATLFGDGVWIYAKAELAQWLLHRAWARTRAGETRVTPWPWADTWPVARLRLPKMAGDFIVLEGTTGRTLAFGPGHWSGTAMPGEAGHCILSAHRDTQFSGLARLAPGDSVSIETASGKRFVYRVDGLRIVDRRERRALELSGSGPGATLSLVTCYPLDGVVPRGPLRYVVTASLR